MKNAKFNGDTKTGRRLQKKADEKRDRVQIAAYLELDLDGLNEDQIRVRIFELSEKHGKD
jgi:hypothetical protein